MTNIPNNKAIAKISFEDTSIAFQSKSNFELKKSLFLFALMNKNYLVKIGTFIIKLALWLHLPVNNLIKWSIFGQFCGGEELSDCNNTIANLSKNNLGTILDYSVEGEGDENSFEKTFNEIIKTIDKAKNNQSIPFAVFKVSGIANTEILEKIQNNELLEDEEKNAFEKAKIRFHGISEHAHNQNVKIFVDAEESWIQDVIDELANEMMAKYNKKSAIIFNTYQLYRKDTLGNLKAITEKAQKQQFFIGVKLVRGAYMEKERIRSHEKKYSEPIQPDKPSTDNDYNRAIDFCIENKETISICLGTHNEFSCLYLVEKMAKLGINTNDPRFYFAQLLGMSDNISYNLSKAGYNVAKYVPYGPVDAVMPYLFRRAEENTSMAGQTSREYSMLLKENKRRANKL